jgi:hypothetical protein
MTEEDEGAIAYDRFKSLAKKPSKAVTTVDLQTQFKRT